MVLSTAVQFTSGILSICFFNSSGMLSVIVAIFITLNYVYRQDAVRIFKCFGSYIFCCIFFNKVLVIMCN